jgi:hypothetical protein
MALPALKELSGRVADGGSAAGGVPEVLAVRSVFAQDVAATAVARRDFAVQFTVRRITNSP